MHTILDSTMAWTWRGPYGHGGHSDGASAWDMDMICIHVRIYNNYIHVLSLCACACTHLGVHEASLQMHEEITAWFISCTYM